MGSKIFQLLYTLPVRLDTLKTTNSRSLQSPPAADRKLEKNPQEINEENCQAHKIYNFQNCGTVNLNVDSFNTRTITMENCGNKVTICSSFFLPLIFVTCQVAEIPEHGKVRNVVRSYTEVLQSRISGTTESTAE